MAANIDRAGKRNFKACWRYRWKGTRNHGRLLPHTKPAVDFSRGYDDSHPMQTTGGAGVNLGQASTAVSTFSTKQHKGPSNLEVTLVSKRDQADQTS